MDLVLSPVKEIKSPCGKFWENIATVLHKKWAYLSSIHILEAPQILVHIWGYDLG